MKILRITSDLYPYVIGGICIHTHEMSTHQVKNGYDVTVYTLINKNKNPDLQINYKIVKVKNIFTFLGNSIAPSLLFKLFPIRYDYDIIHAHSHLYFSTNICALIRRFGSSPLIITNHGIMSSSAPEWFNRLYLKSIGKWTLNSADKIICYTQEEKERLISFLNIDEKKIVVIPNGVNTELFCPYSLIHPTHHPTLLWVGRFVEAKGINYFIQAIKILKNNFPDIRVILIGEGPLKTSIEKTIEEFALQKIISIEPFLTYEKMPEVYRNCDIFVLPSLFEGVPRTVLEAMACGKPVIMTDLHHLNNLIRDAGLTFKAKDVSELVVCINQLISDEQMRRELGMNGRNKVINDYSWDNTVKKTNSLYSELVSSMQVP